MNLYDILKGKKLSVFGASMCTYDGYSNNTEHNPTIGQNKQYYGRADSENVKCRDLAVRETFWGILLEKYGMELCVNNSWSGSKILDDNLAAAGWNTRPTELHRPDGTTPDVIVSFMGNNDFSKERPAGEVTDDLFDRVSVPDFVPSTFAEGYATMLFKVTHRYPNAKTFAFNMAWRTAEKSELLIKYNEIIEKVTAHYGVYIVRLTESRMSGLDYAKYTCDGKLHPNAEGMAVWAELIEDSMKKCYEVLI
jgi:lysophospholipase L1-like esterase